MAPSVSRIGSLIHRSNVAAACLPIRARGERTRPGTYLKSDTALATAKRYQDIRQLHPLVPPQVLHFMQVPFRTKV